MSLPDVQNYRSLHHYRLTRVGVTGIRKPIHVTRGGRDNALVGAFDVFVDLPPEQRGTHMSRNVESINRTIDQHVREPASSLEGLASAIAKDLLERHPYASMAEVEITADYFRERLTPANGAPTLEHYELYATATAPREGKLRRGIGAQVIGMSACPCAMEGTRHVYAERGIDFQGCPTPTHNQRNNVNLYVECAEGSDGVEANDLIDIAEQALSAPTYELLKRGDETALVLQAHENPRFVEDVVREALAAVAKRYAHLPGDTLIVARSDAEESIHKHNAVAERVTTLEELLE